MQIYLDWTVIPYTLIMPLKETRKEVCHKKKMVYFIATSFSLTHRIF